MIRRPSIQVLGRGAGANAGRPCCYCGTAMTSRSSAGDRPTRDHVVPQSEGGRRSKWCCSDCNLAKASLMPSQFYDLCWAVANGAAHFAKKRWGWYLEKAKLVAERHDRESIYLGLLDLEDYYPYEHRAFRSLVLDYLRSRGLDATLRCLSEENLIRSVPGSSPRSCAEAIVSFRRESLEVFDCSGG